MSNIMKEIENLCNRISSSKIDGLRIEEELLLMLVRNESVGLGVKSEALCRMREINRRQLKILGENLNSN